MRTFASPRRGYCASCDGALIGTPVYRMDEAYCCAGCAQGGPCLCTYEADLADDGVDHLGLPFLVKADAPAPATTGEATSRDKAAVPELATR